MFSVSYQRTAQESLWYKKNACPTAFSVNTSQGSPLLAEKYLRNHSLYALLYLIKIQLHYQKEVAILRDSKENGEREVVERTEFSIATERFTE